MNELEKAILDMVEKRYEHKYIGGIKVVKLGDEGYKLILNLGNPDVRMIQISAQLNAEDFLKFIEKELISRQLIKSKWYKINRVDNEKRRTC